MSSSSPFLIHKAPCSSLKISDTKPVLWQEEESSASIGTEQQQQCQEQRRAASSSSSNKKPCGVCRNHEARYCCPKCELDYCSVACYRDHQGSCTESFYQTRVNQVLELEVKERQDETRRLLNRIHREQEEEDSVDIGVAEVIPKEDLYHILKALEDGKEQELERILQRSPKIRTAVDHAVRSGELQDWLLEPWNPWWRPTLVTDEGDRREADDEDEAVESVLGPTTLDERLLEIPCFSSLRPNTTTESLPALESNLIDLLYSLALTLRLYHGLHNAQESAVPASSTLIEFSSVLSRDSRFTTVPEALMSSVVGTLRGPSSFVNQQHTPWDVLANDVALLCQNRRLVARALFDAMDILKAAVAVAKKVGDKEGAAQMRRMRKKLEFYLSWSREPSAPIATLPNQIEAWVAEWKLHEKGVEEMKLPQCFNY